MGDTKAVKTDTEQANLFVEPHVASRKLNLKRAKRATKIVEEKSRERERQKKTDTKKRQLKRRAKPGRTELKTTRRKELVS